MVYVCRAVLGRIITPDIGLYWLMTGWGIEGIVYGVISREIAVRMRIRER